MRRAMRAAPRRLGTGCGLVRARGCRPRSDLGFPTRLLPKPKNRVTRSFFKTEKPVLAACKPVFFGFEF